MSRRKSLAALIEKAHSYRCHLRVSHFLSAIAPASTLLVLLEREHTMKVPLVNPDVPDTFRDLKSALEFISKKSILPQLGLSKERDGS